MKPNLVAVPPVQSLALDRRKNRRAEREAAARAEQAAEVTPFDESQFVRRGRSPETEVTSVEDLTQQLAEQEGILEGVANQTEQVSTERNIGWGRPEDIDESELNKPYLTQLVEYFTAGGFKNPEEEALDELKSNIDPNITDPRQRGEVAVSFLREHREYQAKRELDNKN